MKKKADSPKRPRGRPRIYPVPDPTVKRPRGRPRKNPLAATSSLETVFAVASDDENQPRGRRKRGGTPAQSPARSSSHSRVRGRPRKRVMDESDAESDATRDQALLFQGGRGRKRRKNPPEDSSSPAKRGRGRSAKRPKEEHAAEATSRRVRPNTLSSAYDVLSASTQQFLSSIGITTAEQFLSTRTTDIASEFVEWRVREGKPELKGSGAIASVSGWKTMCRNVAEDTGLDVKVSRKKRKQSAPESANVRKQSTPESANVPSNKSRGSKRASKAPPRFIDESASPLMSNPFPRRRRQSEDPSPFSSGSGDESGNNVGAVATAATDKRSSRRPARSVQVKS